MPAGYLPVVFTGFAARHELVMLQKELEFAASENRIRIEDLSFRDPHLRRLKQLVDKGEAEAIAWLLSQSRSGRPVFVTRDAVAARQAIAERLSCTDVLGVIVDLLHLKMLTTDEAKEMLAVWDDKAQMLCRPRDWEGFDSTVTARQQRGAPYSPRS
jgi:predicted nucleic acid-binding protein